MDMTYWAPISALMQFGRLDAELALYHSPIIDGVPVETLFSTVPQKEVDVSDLPVPYRYCEIGHVDHTGRLAPFLVENDPTVDKQKETERIVKKIHKGNIMAVHDWSVLIPKTRAYQGKFVLVSGRENVFFTTAFLIISPSKDLMAACDEDQGVATCLLFLAAKRELVPMFSAISVWGKSYPTLTDKHLHGIQISRQILERVLSQRWIDNARELRDVIDALQNAETRFLRIVERNGL